MNGLEERETSRESWRAPAEPAGDQAQILILAPSGNDAALTSDFLNQAGRVSRVCSDMAELCRQLETSCDLILLAEETLNVSSVKLLEETLSRQPAWSDIPVTIITSGGEASAERLRTLSSIGPRGNIGLLERPFRRATLLSTVEVGLRARRRQRQIRRLLAEREEAQATLERVVKERTVELSETNAQLETLVYSIAHDLRAPLRSMQAYSKILLEDYAPRLDHDATHFAERIVNSAERMDALVLDLLAYGKMARSEIELEPVSLEEAWQMALNQFEEEIEACRAEITTWGPLPKVQAHAATLSQVLANLLGNALKFVSPGVAPKVSIRSEEKKEMVKILVEDNGIGIPAEYHEKIFRVFERLENDNCEGTGIGLSIVRKGVERMGGKVGVESGPPRTGSLFWIELRKASTKS